MLYVTTGLLTMVVPVTRKLFAWLISCFAGLALFAAPANGFELGLTEAGGGTHIWRSQDGLPSDSVTAIIQTRDGYLWVGTSAGLVRFDGVRFTPVKLVPNSTNSLIRVSALCEDSNGSLWVGSQQDGLFQLHQGKVRQFTKTQGLLDESVTSLAADNQGSVWIGTKSGLNLFAGDYLRALTVRDGLPDEFVSSVHVARSGTIWITTRGGICRFINGHIKPYAFHTESQGRSPEYLGVFENRSGNLWAFGDTYLINLAEGKRFNYFRGTEAASMRIWSLCEGRDGRLWIGTSGRGLFCFDDNRFQPVVLGELRWPYDVRAISEDREGNLWLGTSSGGLVQLRAQPVHILRTGQGLPSSPPTSLASDAAGRVHVGLQRGGLFVGEAGRFDRFGGGGGLEVQDFVSSLCVAPDGAVWAGTLGGGLYGFRNGHGIQITTANGLADDSVLAVCVDGTGAVWASTSSGTVHKFAANSAERFDRTCGLSGAPVTVIVPAAAGGLWLGSVDGVILRSQQEKFSTVPIPRQIANHCILALHEGEQERLWVGTAGGGLACLSKGTLMSWNSTSGLPSDVVAGVVEDATKNLWIATGAGIYRINRSAVQKSLDDPRTPLVCKLMSDAKTGTESTATFAGNRTLLSPEGKLWFATSEGVLNVDTHRPEVESSTLPIQIESVAFNGQPSFSVLSNDSWSSGITNDTPINAPGELRSLEIHFTALSFIAPEKIRFRYKLEGFDLDWVENAADRFAKYGRLPYGRYRFRIAARNPDGVWQEAAKAFAFVVPTPLYLQPWAITLYAISAVMLVAGIVRVVSHRRLRHVLAHLEQQQSLERERMRIARDMHDEMGSKLTKISFLSEHVQMEKELTGPVAGKIKSIAETSRDLLQTMDEIVWVVNPRNDTLEHLVAYLGHYASEYFQNTSVECDQRLPRSIPHHPLSSEVRHNLFLTFEEALNNVLKHSSATLVKVEMNVHESRFEITIVDNGKGFEVPTMPAPNGQATPKRGGRGGNGLGNMSQRLMDVGGECLISSQRGTGTTVTIRIRLNPNNKS